MKVPPSIDATKEKVVKSVKSAAKKTQNTITENPIQTVKVVGVIVGAYFIYKLVKTINKRIDETKIDNEVDGTGGNTNTATISNQLATNYAQQLLDAFNAKEPFYGTDEEMIKSVFNKLKNGADFLKVYYAFGNKDYNGHNSPPEGFWQYLDSYEKRNLIYWLKSEVDPKKDAELYTIIKNRIESAGFAF
ncbi:hypothetical protein [Bizionia paragorgiae]|uniref:Uncharacterized protein n=1 Tax=Bizionia paragorgiae TaxID=283786 RepID=A0A1H3YN32_BIZPA|nr:hypothetical protein [Bizionia paragorgiae]SEA12950.1 hypothetical protein SAMN04487990_10712 [Bizionia paragorgiae]